MYDFRKLQAYQKAFSNSMYIFEYSKEFPDVEKYALTDQLRRSSRSVCANIAEAYRKRGYPKDFAAKLAIADAENSETIVWLEFAKACGYLSPKKYLDLLARCREIGRLLHYMRNNPHKFGGKSSI